LIAALQPWYERTLRQVRGSVTAEFAIALPGLMLLAALLFGVVGAGFERLHLVELSGVAARALGRGESLEQVRARLAALDSSVALELVPVPGKFGEIDAEFVCARASRPVGGALAAFGLEASELSCQPRAGL
jgi:hypothetical protein